MRGYGQNNGPQVVNNARKTNSKSVVQPIMRDDGTVAVTDEEIFEGMKKRYGKFWT